MKCVMQILRWASMLVRLRLVHHLFVHSFVSMVYCCKLTQTVGKDANLTKLVYFSKFTVCVPSEIARSRLTIATAHA